MSVLVIQMLILVQILMTASQLHDICSGLPAQWICNQLEKQETDIICTVNSICDIGGCGTGSNVVVAAHHCIEKQTNWSNSGL